MELSIEGNNDAVTIHVRGEIVAESCGDLRTAVMEAIGRKPAVVSLGLAEVPFIDTSGIGVLVGLRAHLKSRKIVLEVRDPSPRVRQVLRMMHLLPVFGLGED